MARGTDSQKTNKSENTKRHIVSSFLLLMHEKPWEKISVIETCRKAEITRGTFYQYFGDIYDLIEQLEHSLISDLNRRLAAIPEKPQGIIRIRDFPDKFNYAPPPSFLVWFEFCGDHRDALIALFDRKNGDPYFVKKVKSILKDSIESVMENEGTANDYLRSHFLTVFMELHILAAQTWLENEDENESPISVDDIVNLLNTMRVGSQYLSYKRYTDPDFEKKMRNTGDAARPN